MPLCQLLMLSRHIFIFRYVPTSSAPRLPAAFAAACRPVALRPPVGRAPPPRARSTHVFPFLSRHASTFPRTPYCYRYLPRWRACHLRTPLLAQAPVLSAGRSISAGELSTPMLLLPRRHGTAHHFVITVVAGRPECRAATSVRRDRPPPACMPLTALRDYSSAAAPSVFAHVHYAGRRQTPFFFHMDTLNSNARNQTRTPLRIEFATSRVQP